MNKMTLTSNTGLFDNTKPKKTKDKKRNITAGEKQFLWKSKKRHICPICNLTIKDFFDAEFDHKRAHAKGGSSSLQNTLILHRWCNRVKSSKTIIQIKKRLGTHVVKKRKSHNKQNKSKIEYRINLLTGKREKIQKQAKNNFWLG